MNHIRGVLELNSLSHTPHNNVNNNVNNNINNNVNNNVNDNVNNNLNHIRGVLELNSLSHTSHNNVNTLFSDTSRLYSYTVILYSYTTYLVILSHNVNSLFSHTYIKTVRGSFMSHKWTVKVLSMLVFFIFHKPKLLLARLWVRDC